MVDQEREVLDQLPAPICVLDHNYCVEYANRELRSCSEVEVESLAGEYFPRWLPGCEEDELISVLAGLSSTKQRESIRTRARLEGSLNSYDWTVQLQQEDPRRFYVVGKTVERDAGRLGEAIQQHIELDRGNHWFEELADTLNQGLFVLPPDYSEVLYLNSICEQLYDLPLDTLYSDPMAWLEKVHPEDREQVEAQLEEQELGTIGGQQEQEFRILRDDGTITWLHVTIYGISNEQNRPDLIVGISQDITDRKQVELELEEANQEMVEKNQQLQETKRKLAEEIEDRKEAQRELDLGLEAGGIGIWKWNLQNDELSWDEQTHKNMGVPVDREIELNDFFRLIHPEDQQLVEEEIEQTLEQGQEYEVEFRCGDDDDLRWISTSARVFYEAGEPIQMLGTSQDITEEKQLQKRLEEREERFRQMAETINEVHWLANVDLDDLLYINSAAQEVFGFAPQELYQDASEFFDAIRAGGQVEQRDLIEQVRNGQTGDYEFRYERPGGDTVWIRTTISPVRDDTGEVVRLAGVNRDITEEKELQNEIRDQRDFLQTVIDAAEQPIFVKNWQGEYVLVNEATAELADKTKEEVIGARDEELFGEEVGSQYREVDQEIMRTGNTKRTEEQVPTPDGQTRYYYTIKVPLDTDKPPRERRVLGVTSDITERREMEEQLERSLEQKKTLLQEVHHRVKNNMQLIVSLLSLQSREIQDPAVQNKLEEAQNRVRSMSLIHEKLYQMDDLAELNLAEYLTDLIDQLLGFYASSNVQEQVHVETHIEPVKVSLDFAIPCGLIMNELVSNCMEHALDDHEDPQLSIHLEHQSDGKIRLVVLDNGPGLPEEVDPNNPETMGLTLLQTLTGDQLNGELSVHSDASGTEFELLLPLGTG